MKMGVVVVDMLNDFVTGSMKVDRASRIIPNIKRLLDFARNMGIPVVYTNDSHLPGDVEFNLWPPHAIAGTEGSEVIEELKPTKGDYVIQKQRYSAFYGTNLDHLLMELQIDTLVLVGLVTDVCILLTAADAFFRGYKIIIPVDCVETITEETQRFGIEYLRTKYGCEVIDSSELIKRG